MLPVTLGQSRFSLLAVTMLTLLAMDPGQGLAARKNVKRAVVAEKAVAEKAVAEMGGVRLTANYFKKLMLTLDPEDRSRLAANPRALQKVVTEELVKQFLIHQAKKEGWEQRAAVKAIMDQAANEALFTQYLLDRVSPDAAYPTEQMVGEVFEKNKDRLVHPDRVHLAQVFLAMVVDNIPRPDMDKRVTELRARLADEVFTEVAKELSDHKESAAKGGDLGWQDMTGLGPELRPIVAGLKPGEISPPLKSEKGWHIFKLMEREVGKALSLEEARPVIVNSLRASMAKNKEGLFLEELINRYPPKINEGVLGGVLGR